MNVRYAALVVSATLMFSMGCTEKKEVESQVSTRVDPKATVAATPTAEPTPTPAPTPAFESKAIAVEVRGEGRPMIIIPGLACPPEVLQPVIDHYASTYQLHLVSLAGMGGMESVPAPLLPKYREGLVAYLQANDIKDATIIGQGLGGTLAYWIASNEPDRFHAVVVLEGSPAMNNLIYPNDDFEKTGPSIEKYRDRLASMDAAAYAKQRKFALGTMLSSEPNVLKMTELTSKSDPAAEGQAHYELFSTDIRSTLAAIKAPVLLIVGAGGTTDPAAIEATSKNFGRQLVAIKDLKISVSPASKHFIQFDTPDFLFAEMDEFFASHP
jgi:N-formylmaleamate deformylase